MICKSPDRLYSWHSRKSKNRAWIFTRYREQESYPDLFSYLPHLINHPDFFFTVFESQRNCFSDQIPNVTRERIAFFLPWFPFLIGFTLISILDRILFKKYLITFVQATKSAAVFDCALIFWAGCREFRSAWTTTVNAYILHEIPECLHLRPSTDAGRACSYHDRYWVALVYSFMGADPGLLAQRRVRWRANSFTARINLLFFV